MRRERVAPAGGVGSAGRSTVAVALLLVSVTVMAFLPVARNDFVSIDDEINITGNVQVLRGLTWSGVRWAFTSVGYHSIWQPLTWISHMLDVEFFGLAPGGHHLMSLALHAGTAALLFLLLRGMTGVLWPGAFAAALFALHPLRVESVAWAAERKDVLAGFFWVLSILLYARYARRPGAGRWLAVAFSFACALLSKATALTLPVVLVLLDYWPLGRPLGPPAWRRQFLEKGPLLLLSVGAAAIAQRAQAVSGAVAQPGGPDLGLRLANAATFCAAYLGKLLWPADLSFLYRYPERMPSPAALAAALALIAALAVAAIAFRRRCPALSVGGFWYFATLLPVLGILQVGAGRHGLADRYTYLPSIGVSLAIAWCAAALVRRRPGAGRLFAALGAAWLLALVPATWLRVQVWRDTETLGRQALGVDPDNDVARLALAIFLHQRGELGPAMEQYREAIRLRPDAIEAYLGLGLAHGQLGLPQEEVAVYEQALKVAPDSPRIYVNLMSAYRTLGRGEDAARAWEQIRRLTGQTPALPSSTRGR